MRLSASAISVVLSSMAIAGASALVNPASASADGYVCPRPPDVYMTLGAGARCVGLYHNGHRQIWFRNDYTDVSKCVAIKPNADGSGGDIGRSADCQPYRVDAELLFSYPGVNGYGTMINQGNLHTGFRGWNGFW
jgi:hypothetical protein